MFKTLLAKNLKLPNFYSSPFVYFFCLYSSGILIQRDLLALTAITSIPFYFGLLLILLYFFNRNYYPGTKLSFVLLSTLFFSLGQIQLNLLNSRNIPKIQTSENEMDASPGAHAATVPAVLTMLSTLSPGAR